MQINTIKTFQLTLVLLVLGLIAGCGDDFKARIDAQIPITAQKIDDLRNALQQGTVTNAVILKSYAKHIAEAKPQFADLAKTLSYDASFDGPLFKSLEDRLDNARQDSGTHFTSDQERLSELIAIKDAANPTVYSDALSDVVNVLADLSGGELARVNAVPKQTDLRMNGSEDFGHGSQLVGNPNYGQWRTNSSGLSFWEWYGAYALLSNVIGGRGIFYNDWASRRGYSYYHDVGRSRYTSPRQYRNQTKQIEKAKKSFSSRGQRFASPYAKARTGTSGLSSQSVAGAKSTRFAKASSGSRFGSSYRNSGVRSSRGFSRGK